MIQHGLKWSYWNIHDCLYQRGGRGLRTWNISKKSLAQSSAELWNHLDAFILLFTWPNSKSRITYKCNTTVLNRTDFENNISFPCSQNKIYINTTITALLKAQLKLLWVLDLDTCHQLLCRRIKIWKANLSAVKAAGACHNLCLKCSQWNLSRLSFLFCFSENKHFRKSLISHNRCVLLQ